MTADQAEDEQGQDEHGGYGDAGRGDFGGGRGLPRLGGGRSGAAR
jgi:hypothetical protein